MWPNPQFPADMFTFTEEILNRKLHFLCGGSDSRLSSNSNKFFHKRFSEGFFWSDFSYLQQFLINVRTQLFYKTFSMSACEIRTKTWQILIKKINIKYKN